MTYVLGQHTGTAYGGQDGTLAFGGSVTSGNLLIYTCSYYNASGTIFTAMTNTGTAGVQSWHPFLTTPFQSSTAAITEQMWWAIASGTGTCTPTVTWSPAGSGGDCFVSEWSGTSISGSLTQDQSGVSSQGTTGTINLPSLATTFADDLVIGYVATGNASTVVSPWTGIDVAGGDRSFFRSGLAANTYTPNITQTSSSYACIMAALGTSSGGGALSVNPTELAIGSSESSQAPLPSPIGVIN